MPDRSRLLLGFALLLAPPPATTETVRIFAAASLTDAIAEAARRFEKAHPDIRVVPQFGGSSDLARQILAGAPADLFFSADERQVKRLTNGGDAPRERTNLLSNRLVVVRSARAESGKAMAFPADLTKLGRIAMADPYAVPAGVYTRLYLESKGLWSRVHPRVVPTLDVRGALAAVASGNVDAGVVYRTDAAIEPRVRVVYEVPENESPEIVYVLALLGPAARPEVQALYEFLRSPAALEIFEGYGFVARRGSP